MQKLAHTSEIGEISIKGTFKEHQMKPQRQRGIQLRPSALMCQNLAMRLIPPTSSTPNDAPNVQRVRSYSEPAEVIDQQ